MKKVTEARRKTEQAIDMVKTTYFGIVIILGCFKVLLELLWETGSFYSEYMDGRIAAHLIQLLRLKETTKQK